MKEIGSLDIPKTTNEKFLSQNLNNLDRIQTAILGIKNTIIALREGVIEIDHENLNEVEETYWELIKESRFFGYDPRLQYSKDNKYRKGKNGITYNSGEFFYKNENILKAAWFLPTADPRYLEIVNEFRNEIHRKDFWWIFPKIQRGLDRFYQVSDFHLEILDNTLEVVYNTLTDLNEFESRLLEEDAGSVRDIELSKSDLLIEKERVVCGDFQGNPLAAKRVYNFFFLDKNAK